MVIWGMGLPLGLTAWAGLLWMTWRSMSGAAKIVGRRAWSVERESPVVSDAPAIDVPAVVDARGQATVDEIASPVEQAPVEAEWMRHALPVIWAAGMFLFMGTRAVSSMRYFLPIYPFLALCAAWAVLEVWNWATRVGRPQGAPIRAVLAGALAVIVLGGTAAWAYGFTNVYRTDNTRIRAARWVYQNVDGPVNVYVADASGARRTSRCRSARARRSATSRRRSRPSRRRPPARLTRVSVGFARNSDDLRVPGVLNVIVSPDPGGATVLAEANLVIQGTDGESDPRGLPAEVAFAQPASLQADTNYYVLLRAVSGAPITLSGSVISHENSDRRFQCAWTVLIRSAASTSDRRWRCIGPTRRTNAT